MEALIAVQPTVSPVQILNPTPLPAESSLALPLVDDPETPWEACETGDRRSIPSAVTPTATRTYCVFREDDDVANPGEPLNHPLPSVQAGTAACADPQGAAAAAPVRANAESITLNKVIVAPCDSEADGGVDSPLFLLNVPDDELLDMGLRAADKFRVSRLQKATILAEAKRRYGNGGASGRRPKGEMSWRGYCDAIGEPLASADALVSSLKTFRDMEPALQQAALDQGVDLLKPKVQQVLLLLQEEIWSGDSMSSDHCLDLIKAGVERLREAEGRDATPSAPPKLPLPTSPNLRTVGPVRSGESRPHPALRGPGSKVIPFTAAELRRGDAALAQIRAYDGWGTGALAESEIYIRGLEMLAKSLGGAA